MQTCRVYVVGYGCTLEVLEVEVFDFDPLTVNEALTRLAADGVVILDGERVRASACARRIDAWS